MNELIGWFRTDEGALVRALDHDDFVPLTWLGEQADHGSLADQFDALTGVPPDDLGLPIISASDWPQRADDRHWLDPAGYADLVPVDHVVGSWASAVGLGDRALLIPDGLDGGGIEDATWMLFNGWFREKLSRVILAIDRAQSTLMSVRFVADPCQLDGHGGCQSNGPLNCACDGPFTAPDASGNPATFCTCISPGHQH